MAPTRPLLFLALVTSFAFAQDYPRYDIRRASGKIKVDGKLNDRAWKKANVATDFHFNWYASGVKEKTEVRLLWDDEKLYIGYYCHDKHISAKVTERHGPVSLDDCVEAFISPNPDPPPAGKRPHYYGFEMNVIGTMLNFIRADWYTGGRNWEPEGVELHTSYQGLRPGKEESPNDDHWILEVAIPFKNFAKDAKHTPPQNGDTWRLNLNRSGGKTDAQYSTWSPVKTPKPNFHRPEDFGYVTFRK